METLRDEITISELAKLMQVSVHQIRYFEDKDVLKPKYVADNQYRMYGINEIYRLAHILLLRKMGLSVQVIKDCLESLSSDQMGTLFNEALSHTEAAIAQLLETKSFITRLLQEQQHTQYQDEIVLKMVHRDALPLSLWFCIQDSAPLNAKLLASHQGEVPNLFEADIHYVYHQSGAVEIYTPSHKDSGDLVLPVGNYVSCQLLAQDEKELDEHISRFYIEVENQGLDKEGPLIIVEKSYLSLFTPEQIHYELLLKVKGSSYRNKDAKR